MKCLIIATDIGESAPGIVYETIIEELCKCLDISIITLKKRNDIFIPVRFLPVSTIKYEHTRISKLFISYFGRNFYDDVWLFKQEKLIKSNIVEEQDFVISFMSYNNYKSVLLGRYLANKYKKKWIIYSVDAVPAPLGWSSDGLLFRNTKKLISKFISRCDAFFSSNSQMLEYQLSLVNKQPSYTGYIYTPSRKELHYGHIATNSAQMKEPVFLYTGGIYGPRRVDTLLGGFKKLLKDYPSAKLVFVGLNTNVKFNSYEDLIASQNIEIHGYTRDLEKYYEDATVLIDLNAYFDNDIFLSSKIINYLPLSKPIISITGLNSPSRNIFTKDQTIIHCRHNIDEIYNSMIVAITQSFDYANRKMYIEKFMASNVIEPLMKFLRNDKLLKSES